MPESDHLWPNWSISDRSAIAFKASHTVAPASRTSAGRRRLP
jgi:hypothetical protein